MTTAPIWQRVYKGFRQFGRSKGGNITITFAFASIPLFGMAGAALDYSRANSARTAMQAAVDSAALMLSKDAQTLSTTA
ncbi:MAG TPA: pilus assembly protein TadG-related protein [Xanthobacteraceae bacterium]|nr:pilus assembly protein TadG-related protein [Xanthobacteraceae bacterium]